MKPCSPEDRDRMESTASTMGRWLLAAVAAVLIVGNGVQLVRVYCSGPDRPPTRRTPLWWRDLLDRGDEVTLKPYWVPKYWGDDLYEVRLIPYLVRNRAVVPAHGNR